MFFIYKLLVIVFIIFSPITFVFRIFLGKEDPDRFLEKFSIYKKKVKIHETVWFHGASVGEILSIIPIINILEKNVKVKKILITSSTVSSASIISNYNFKKTKHVYFPIDSDFFINKFIKTWKPKVVFFIDSEIWPNFIKNLYRKNIPIILLNGRITAKSFNRWMTFKSFAKEIFSKINISLPQNLQSAKYLKRLGAKNIKIAGNLKYFGEPKKIIDNKIKVLFKNRVIFCAASTHFDEENKIAKAHIDLKNSIPNLLTVIIPRHTHRSKSIMSDLNNFGLKFVSRKTKLKINKDTDIYLVDTYGEALKFYALSKVSFIGGSLINHGGQNPLEPARLGNFILHGPHINNFYEVYTYLSKFKNSFKINDEKSIKKIVLKKINFKQKLKIKRKLYRLGNLILKNNLKYINKFI